MPIYGCLSALITWSCSTETSSKHFFVETLTIIETVSISNLRNMKLCVGPNDSSSVNETPNPWVIWISQLLTSVNILPSENKKIKINKYHNQLYVVLRKSQQNIGNDKISVFLFPTTIIECNIKLNLYNIMQCNSNPCQIHRPISVIIYSILKQSCMRYRPLCVSRFGLYPKWVLVKIQEKPLNNVIF